MGVTEDDMTRLTRNGLWTAQDRVAIQRTVQALRDGLAVAQSFQPFQVPAEYLAALVVGFVHPVNYAAACAWLAAVNVVPAEELASGVPVGSAEAVTPERLYALVLHANAGPDGTTFYDDYASKVAKQLGKAGVKKGE